MEPQRWSSARDTQLLSQANNGHISGSLTTDGAQILSTAQIQELPPSEKETHIAVWLTVRVSQKYILV